MPAPISRATRIYLAAWRKAYRERDQSAAPVSLLASTKQLAIAHQQNLYRAIRPYRNGHASDDELNKAWEVLVVAIHDAPDGLYEVRIQPRLTLAELEKEFSRLGLSEDDLITTEERKVTEELKTLLSPENGKTNPFYRR